MALQAEQVCLNSRYEKYYTSHFTHTVIYQLLLDVYGVASRAGVFK